MDGNIIAAIIAASIAAVTGITNVFLAIHRNKQDGITAYRMQWINEIRLAFAEVFSWKLYTQNSEGNMIACPIEDFNRSIYLISLLLNVKDDYDKKVLDKLFEYQKEVTKTYETLYVGNSTKESWIQLIMLDECRDAVEKAEKTKKELLSLVRIYLKTEWTRVKVDSSILKIRYWYCWKPFYGFQSEKVIQKISSECKSSGKSISRI